jgi:hypothetical protein
LLDRWCSIFGPHHIKCGKAKNEAYECLL